MPGVKLHIINGVDMTTVGFRNAGLVSMYEILLWIMSAYCFGTMIYTAHAVDKGSPDRPVWILLCPIVLGLGLIFLAIDGVRTGAGIRKKFNYFRLNPLRLGWQYLWMAFTSAVGAITIWKNYEDGCFKHTQTDSSLCVGAPAIGPICALAGLGWMLVVILHTYLHITEQNYQESRRVFLAQANNGMQPEYVLAHVDELAPRIPRAHVARERVQEV